MYIFKLFWGRTLGPRLKGEMEGIEGPRTLALRGRGRVERGNLVGEGKGKVREEGGEGRFHSLPANPRSATGSKGQQCHFVT